MATHYLNLWHSLARGKTVVFYPSATHGNTTQSESENMELCG